MIQRVFITYCMNSLPLEISILNTRNWCFLAGWHSVGVAPELHYLHTGGTDESVTIDYMACHRDIKSANICITADYWAKIIDCCLGKIVAKDTKLLTQSARNEGGIGTRSVGRARKL